MIEGNEFYNDPYVEKIGDLLKTKEEDEAQEILKEMREMRYEPSEEPALDAEVNFLKAEKAVRKKTKINNPYIKSYARFIQHEHGLSDAEIKRRVREALNGGE